MEAFEPLPVPGRRLAEIPEVAEAARQVVEAYGINLVDDTVAQDVIIRHNLLKDTGGWHDEVGGLLVIGGVVAAAVLGSSMASPPESGQIAGLIAACLAVPLGILVWVAGFRQGRTKREALAHFAAYTALLELARDHGAAVPIPAQWSLGRAEVLGERQDDRGLLPLVPVDTYARHPTVRAFAAQLGTRNRIDYFDANAIRTLLAEQKRYWGQAVFRLSTSFCLLLAAAGALWVSLSLDTEPSVARPASAATVLLALAGLLFALSLTTAVLGAVTLRRRALSGVRAQAVGYVAILEFAHECGLPVPVLPSWLDTTERSKKWK
ncbi:hypothetical protein ABT093_18045 [Kitasatospora sp. NPDC002551]|uniref:hypothetical protein n=1 Tax=unclassified Kitasatospora TaxID=2633591 RepID=UPI00331E38E6